MDDMRQGQSQHVDVPEPALAKPARWTRIAQVGTKIAIGLSLMVAGAALAQNAGLVPDLKPKDATVAAAPTKDDLDQAPPPGSQREAKACSDDIKLFCAAQTATRRDVLQCFEDKDAQVSQSCKAAKLTSSAMRKNALTSTRNDAC
jgi:hypothetical protein